MRVTIGFGTEIVQYEHRDSSDVSVRTALWWVREVRPAVFSRWCDDRGRIRHNLGVFVNSEHVRYQDGLDTELDDGDEVYVIPVITGG